VLTARGPIPWTSTGNIAAVQALEALGYHYHGGEWLPPAAPPLPLTAEADAMHGALTRRADPPAGKRDWQRRRSESRSLEAYEAKRWPLGKDPNVPGGRVTYPGETRIRFVLLANRRQASICIITPNLLI
jgi:hypothetical protein